VPSTVDCADPDQPTREIPITWETTGAERVEVAIDGPGVFASYRPNDTVRVPFACPGPHTYKLTAYGPDGSFTSKEFTISSSSDGARPRPSQP
jgi:hypothetical protein